MNSESTNVYFALKGEDFDPDFVTEKLKVIPSEAWRKGDKGKYISSQKYCCWKISIEIGKEYLLVDKLVDEVIDVLYDKIEIINELKKQYRIESVLEIVLYIDCNEENSTPALGHDLKTLEFLYKTGTVTDVDIYRFNSLVNENNEKAL